MDLLIEAAAMALSSNYSKADFISEWSKLFGLSQAELKIIDGIFT